MTENAHRRGWLQFSARTVFWIMLCVAIGLGAYRWGYDAGFVDRANQRHEVGKAYVTVYYVADMTPRTQLNGGLQVDFDRLIDDLTTEVLPNTWTDRGGTAAIKEFQTNQAIVIMHDQDGHERISEYLERRRREKTVPMLTSK